MEHAEPPLLRRRAVAAAPHAGAYRAAASGGAAGVAWPRGLPPQPRAADRGGRDTGMKLDAVADRCQEIMVTLAQGIVDKADVLEHMVAGVVANGHILVEDYPGLA